MTSPDAAATRRRPTARRVVLAILVAGVALRMVRLFDPGFDTDEHFELLARHMTVSKGLPAMPSGAVWIYGGPLVWVGSAAALISKTSVLVERIPFFLIGSAAMWVVTRTARRLFGEGAAIGAAAVMAFHPGLVFWTSSVRPYGALTCLTALAVDRWAAWVLEGDDRAATWFAVWMSLAGLCHPGIAFVVAGLALSAIAVRGVRWALRPRPLLVAAACAAALALLAAAIWIGDPTMTGFLVEEPTEHGAWRRFASWVYHLGRSLRSHGFTSAWHAVPFWLATAAVAHAIVELRRRSTRALGREGTPQRVLALAGAWFVALAVFQTVSHFQGAMYVLPALPALALVAGCGIATLLARLPRAQFTAAPAAALLLALHVATTWEAWRDALRWHAASARMYARLAAEARPGDVSMGVGPAAAVYTGTALTDHLVYSRDFVLSSYVKDGRRYDRVYGNEVLTTLDSVRRTFEGAPRVFYVVRDKERLERISPEVDAWLTSRMDLLDEGDDGYHLYASRR